MQARTARLQTAHILPPYTDSMDKPPQRQKKQPVGIAFVHSDPSSHIKDPNLAKFIRSHVTSVQHSRKRRENPSPLSRGQTSHACAPSELTCDCKIAKRQPERSDISLPSSSASDSSAHSETPTSMAQALLLDPQQRYHVPDPGSKSFATNTLQIPAQAALGCSLGDPTDEYYDLLYPLKLSVRDCRVSSLFCMCANATRN